MKSILSVATAVEHHLCDNVQASYGTAKILPVSSVSSRRPCFLGSLLSGITLSVMSIFARRVDPSTRKKRCASWTGSFSETSGLSMLGGFGLADSGPLSW